MSETEKQMPVGSDALFCVEAQSRPLQESFADKNELIQTPWNPAKFEGKAT